MSLIHKILETFEADLPSITPYQDATTQVISNPNINENNESQNVIEFTKGQSRSFVLFQFDDTFNLDGWDASKVKLHSSNKVGTKFSFKNSF